MRPPFYHLLNQVEYKTRNSRHGKDREDKRINQPLFKEGF